MLWLLHGLSAPALAQDASAPAEAAAPPSQPAAEPERTLTIDAYDIVGNSVLDQVSIEDAVYPYLGPDRTDADVDKARAALEDAYKKKGYETVVVVLPPQDASNGVIRLEVVEAKIGRVRVVGAKYTAPSKIRNEIPPSRKDRCPTSGSSRRKPQSSTGRRIARVRRCSSRGVCPAPSTSTSRSRKNSRCTSTSRSTTTTTTAPIRSA
ncbi:POTRA domain-containing protein [Hankyongella ginsenosidimutans]|uniref:POTRA domain-containing protein n=1 Tax=Hankyongella ginsenosidimutans TaxID=1763828 RepID=UPI001FEC5485|nr:POTRA domain-containing protein [Hankyongella ginsenosidimutans]